MSPCSECKMGDGLHHIQCPNRVKTTTKRLLYCICYEYRVSRGVWDCDKWYFHGDDIEDVRLQFLRSNAPELMREIRIVGIAPVVGYFVDDKKGEQLSV